ncbi:MAG TPA: bifunctional diguanylate cyclase/phosphodiesterase, partial [Erwinia sp.]|nr:bifunctional diguanylate cyclase/phosphodiesterase [Erwinia sp.]
SALWEYGLEGQISTLLGLEYSADFETSERLRFILTSSGFALLAMIIPGLLIGRLVRKMLTAEKNALRLADTDELTGVGNRRAFSARIAQLDAAGQPYFLTLLDINDFKSINDLNGHHQGDATLVSLANLLAESVSPHTHVFRIGGDEFAMTSGGGQPEEAVRTAATLRLRATEIRTGPHTFLGLSIGVACSTCCGGSGIVRAADLAMYEAKRDKTPYPVHFSPDMELTFLRREKLEHDVTEAIKNHAIVPFLQPIVCLQTGRITGFEILARWISGSGKVIAPAVFIPVVEKLGLMDTLTVELLQAVVLKISGWPAGLHLALNITPEQLLNPVLTDCLSDIMQQAVQIKLELEITEQNVMTISEEARQAIRVLQEGGISVVLDDFGTGYSNLSVLLGLGITRIKIDRSFIATVVDASQQQKVVETLLSLCQELKVRVTAEGIEDLTTLEWLQKRYCDYGQGYLFSRPVPVDQATALLDSAVAPGFFTFELVAVV